MKKFFKKINAYLLIINLVFLQSYLIRFSIGPYPSNLQEILITLNAVAFLGYLVTSKRIFSTIKNIPKHWIIFSLFILTIISTTIVPIENKLDFFRHLKFLFFASILAFIFLETFKKSERKNAIKHMGIGALIFGIFSTSYNLLGYNVTHDLRLLGPLDSAVYLAFYLAPFFLFFTFESIKNPKQKNNILYAILLGILLIATRSMGAIGASFISILLFLIFDGKMLRSKSAKILILVLGAFISMAIFYSKILPTLNTEYSSLDERGEIWTISTKLLSESENFIKGLGFGQFQDQYFKNADNILQRQPLDYYVLQPHNIFLLFTVHYGLLGLIFITLILVQTLKKTFQKNSEVSKISLFILIYFLIHGLIDTPLFKNDLLILFIIFSEAALVSISADQKLNPTR